MSIKSVQSQINQALANNHLSVNEANRIIAEAERGPLTAGERALLVDLLDWATPARGKPLPVQPRSSVAARSALSAFLLGKGCDNRVLTDLAIVAGRVTCTAGGNEGGGELVAFTKNGPFAALDDATFRAAFADEITVAIENNDYLATSDRELSMEPASPAKIDEMFSDADDAVAGGVTAFKQTIAKLRDPMVVQLGEGDNGTHPVWVVGHDENNNLVGVQTSVVWT